MTTTDNPGLAEQVAAVLRGHRPEAGHRDLRVHCLCGWTGAELATYPQFIAHQADQLLPLIEAREQEAARQAKRAAWDECDSLWRFAYPLDLSTTNPYGKEES